MKKKQFQTIQFVKMLVGLGERQRESAIKAATLIKDALNRHQIPFSVEKFSVAVPASFAVLKADGKKVPCLPTSFKSGTIIGSENLVSSLIPSRFLISSQNINFNPRSSSISRSNFYFAPSVAISRESLHEVAKASRVKAVVRVIKTSFSSEQILIGNLRNPKSVVFCHYDSIGPGAVDNASGTAVVLSVVVDNPRVLEKNLFVMDGNEELSFDYPTYWGHGYRIFEKRHQRLLNIARRIIVVDSVGNGGNKLTTDKNLAYLAFPVKTKRFREKIICLSGDFDKLMKVYHSNADVLKEVSERSLVQAGRLLRKAISF